MKVVIASGYFDPLHVGHIDLFRNARALGDKLIVLLNNDEQAILKKSKVFMPLKERKIILEALEMVDEVFVSIDKGLPVIESIRKIHNELGPVHIFAKGGDRFVYEIPETPICKELGIEIVDGLGEKIQSSSNLIKHEE
jgi:cytidyltransferase-like protein